MDQRQWSTGDCAKRFLASATVRGKTGEDFTFYNQRASPDSPGSRCRLGRSSWKA